ncbi:MAG TPA: hypothetical protein VIU12_01535 [Chryseolinea sp.]
MAHLQKKFTKLVTFHGSPGQDVVFKVYGDKVIVTKYPDMTNVTWTSKQQEGRSRFKEAQIYARTIMKDAAQLEAFKKRLKPGKRAYTELIREYMLQFKG